MTNHAFKLDENLPADQELQSPTHQPKRPPVSVIIVSYWTGPLLVRSVMSALRQPEVGEVIVVDNGNWVNEMDRLQELAGDYAEKLVILSGHGNIGYAAGCNKGAHAATGEFIFILNPDAILPDDAVADMLSEAAPLEGRWVIGGKLINPDGTEQAGARRDTLTPWRAFVEMTKLYNFAPRHPYFKRFNFHRDPCPGQRQEVPVISGACMLMQRETYFAINGMDEDYFLHVEDIDFCLRLSKAGGSVFYTPKVGILHFKSTSRESRIRVEWRKAKSMIRYFWTHFTSEYPRLFMLLVTALIWVGFGLRSVVIILQRCLALLGLRKFAEPSRKSYQRKPQSAR